MLYASNVITFDREVDHVWNRVCSYGSITYLLIRYIGDALSILNIVAFLGLGVQAPGVDFCGVYFFAQSWLGLLILFLIQLMLQVRLYSLYQGSRIVLTIMLLGYVCEIAAMTAITGIINIYAEIGNQALGGLYICTDVHIPSFYHTYVLWLPVIVYESILYLFVLWYGVGHWMSGYRIKRMADRMSVTDGLVTGNASYFLCIAVGCILSAVIGQHLEFKWTAMYRGYPATTQAMFGCRLILSLRMMIAQDRETDRHSEIIEDDAPWVTAIATRPSSMLCA